MEPETTEERHVALGEIEAALKTGRDLIADGGLGATAMLRSVLSDLGTLGVTEVLPRETAARLSPDNLPSMLTDVSGRSALGQALEVARESIEAMLDTGLHDWWLFAQPQVLVVSQQGSPNQELFESFAVQFERDMGVLRNHSVFLAGPLPHRVHDELLPPVSAIITNHPEYRDLGVSWRVLSIWWEPTSTGFRVSVESPPDETDRTAEFTASQLKKAASFVADWYDSPLEHTDGYAERISIEEHRAIESLIFEVQRGAEPLKLSAPDRARLDALVQMLQIQLRTPSPDRPIISRLLHGLLTFSSGVVTGIAATYLQGALVKFGVNLA